MKTDLFHSCGHCWVFQICWHIECSTFTASSFRIWNNSAGILSPPLALVVVMLPKGHLTSHSRTSGVRFCIFLPSLLLLLDPHHFCPVSCPSLHEMFPRYLQSSWRELWSFPFYCFPLFLCIVHLIRPSYLLTILWNSVFIWVYHKNKSKKKFFFLKIWWNVARSHVH